MKTLKMMLMFAMLWVFGTAVYAVEEVAAPASVPGPQMDPAAMEKMKAYTTPGEAHKALEAFVGKWTYTGKMKMTPDGPEQDMTGIQQNEMVYGGRFLKQQIEGPWMGEKFEGLGYTGYDNIKGEYVTTWIDSMGTGIMTMSGQFDPATHSLKQSGANSCPLTGEKARPGRSEWSVVDPDHWLYSSYMFDANGKEYKMMEITYTREKPAVAAY